MSKRYCAPSALTAVPYSLRRQILQRWAEHFSGVRSPYTIRRRHRPSTASGDQCRPPALHETIRAVQQLSSGKAPGSDAIPAEFYKRSGPQLMDHLTALFQMWHQGEVPQDFNGATIVRLYRRKGDCRLCDNHWGISSMNIIREIFARILLNRLNEVFYREASAASTVTVGQQT
ncbi:hypothetical protein SprV_0100009000 [Sparganum proliferum]